MKKSGRKPRPQEKGRNKRKKKEAISGFSTLNQVAGVSKPKQHHSSLPVEEPKKVMEPHPSCQYCGTEIENIASSLSTPEGGYAHFDCVLLRIRDTEQLHEDSLISYIGGGSFGIIEKGEDGMSHIVKRIQYETPERHKGMKEYVEGLKA